jgi:hypothetical protein
MPRAPEPLLSQYGRVFWRIWEKAYILIFLLFVGGVVLAALRFGWLAVGRGFAGLFAVIGFAVLLYGRRAMRLARESVGWPTVEAQVIRSIVEEQVSTARSPSGVLETIVSYFPEVEYEYDVEGITYTSSRILFVRVNYPKEQAEAVVARYAPGSKVTAYVDPRNPRLAVLEPGLGGHLGRYRLVAVIGAVFAAGGTLVWWLLP